MLADIAPEALPFVVLSDAFSPNELDTIERIGDRLVTSKATLVAVSQIAQFDAIRITEEAWLPSTDGTSWHYAKIVRVLNDCYFQFAR